MPFLFLFINVYKIQANMIPPDHRITLLYIIVFSYEGYVVRERFYDMNMPKREIIIL